MMKWQLNLGSRCSKVFEGRNHQAVGSYGHSFWQMVSKSHLPLRSL